MVPRRRRALRGADMTIAMGDLFPPAPRVIYGKAPLLQVICQLRFPQILRIESEAPAEFQERIRGAFPLLEKVNPIPLPLPPMVAQALSAPGITTSYQFHTEDRGATVELTSQSVTLSTRSYERWEKFRDDLKTPLSAIMDVYRPAFFQRAGLRYQDLILRSKIGLANVPWSRLLGAQLLGELAYEPFEQNLQDARRLIRVKVPPGDGFILLQHGLGIAAAPGATPPSDSEVGYMIDFDFSAEQKIEVSNAYAILDNLHQGVGRAFRWCITDELHEALQPTPIDSDDRC